MASTTNTFNTLNSYFKETYADNVMDLIPDGVILLNKIDFVPAKQQPGNLYHQPVALGHEHGFTYGGSGGSAFALRNAVTSSHEDAQIRGHEMVLRSYISNGAISRSGNDKASFIQASKLIVENMLKSFARRLEVQIMYGQADGGIGVIDSISGSTVTISDQEWAAGIWSGSEKMPVEIRSSAGALRGEATVQKSSLSNKTVTLDALPAGTVATDVLYYAGAYSKEFAGIHKIITNSGSLFNIDASQYSLWQGNVVDVGTSGSPAVLAFDKVEEAAAVSMEKGLFDEDVVVVCNPKSWKNLLTEQTSKRQYDDSYGTEKMENGTREITFYSQQGMMRIVSSIYCKEGFAYVLPLDDYQRIGSADVSLEQPGMEGQFLKALENAAGVEMRAYTDQALFCASPGKSTLLRYIKS